MILFKKNFFKIIKNLTMTNKVNLKPFPKHKVLLESKIKTK